MPVNISQNMFLYMAIHSSLSALFTVAMLFFSSVDKAGLLIPKRDNFVNFLHCSLENVSLTIGVGLKFFRHLLQRYSPLPNF